MNESFARETLNAVKEKLGVSDDLDELTKAEQRGYANAMEAERKLHEDRIEQLERENARLDAGWSDANFRALDAGLKLAKAVAGLKPLVQICEMMRDSSGFRKGRYQHEVTDSQWSAWCKQIKTTRAVLAELEGGE